MKQAIHQIFARWGQSLTVAGQETRAFLQPVRTQGERMPGGMSGSGWLDGRRWHYLGEVPVEAGEEHRVERQGVPGVQQPPLRGGGDAVLLVGIAGTGDGMRELTQVRDAVVSALQEAGLAAEAAFPPPAAPQMPGGAGRCGGGSRRRNGAGLL